METAKPTRNRLLVLKKRINKERIDFIIYNTDLLNTIEVQLMLQRELTS